MPYKHISELTNKGLCNRLESLLPHLKLVSKKLDVSSKTIAKYLLLLCSHEEHDPSCSKLCEKMIAEGAYSPVYNNISCDKAAFYSTH